MVDEEWRVVVRRDVVGVVHLLLREAVVRLKRGPGHREPEALVPLRRLPPLAQPAASQRLLEGDVRPDHAMLVSGTWRPTPICRDSTVSAKQVHRIFGRLKKTGGSFEMLLLLFKDSTFLVQLQKCFTDERYFEKHIFDAHASQQLVLWEQTIF